MTSKKTLYVASFCGGGGLGEEVDEKALQAAFVPFGELKEMLMPLDPATERNKGFAFVEFEDPDDAAHALDNMSEAEFFGKVLKINYARSGTVTKQGGRAVWDSDDYLKKTVAAEDQMDQS